MAKAKGESLLGRVGSDFDGVNVNTAGHAGLEAVVVTCIYDLFAWTCAKNEVVGLDLLRHIYQINEVQGLQGNSYTQLMIG